MLQTKINLLSKTDLHASTVGRVASWSLSVGRWIVIITELIVIAAFGTRFKLDRDIAELNDEINQKAAIVKAYAPFEATFRETKQRLVVLDTALLQQQSIDQILTEIGYAIPDDVVLSSINLSQKLEIKGAALTETGMAGMHRYLEQSPLFSKVTLSRVSVDESVVNGIQFEIRATLNTNNN